ncbi:uncharacterized protein [Rutidosis leptorrhynchoides]|uniref:uncharacterized protein n=1 Tax=Rutidosis leptorrhynchoides TaxID=125765 RepID=UPI003A99AEC0
MQSDDFSEMPIVILCKIAQTGIIIMKVHVDNGSSVDIVYEQCFVQLPESIRANLQPTAASLTGFAGESSLPMGLLPLDVEVFDENDASLARQARLDFYVMRTSSRYNKILGRSALGKFGIVPSTIHGMVKFTTHKGVATISSVSIMPICAAVNVKSAVQETADVADNMVVVNPEYPNQKIKVGCNVSADTKKQIVQLLVQHMDIFSWCENDMTGVPRHIAEHRLNVYPALKPVVQKRRGMAPDRAKWLCEEVTKLVAAARGYHQIPMAREDADKTAFHTGKDIVSHIMMPFGLINAGATYQRLIDTAFEKQIGRNLEAYVDDLVIKSTTQARILNDMRETFDTLHRINMKLNPLKCSFGETEGKFLGYLVTEQGIQANPKKIAAIENMTAPKMVKEVQSLTGKFAALTRFLSKAAERQLPFFKTLKGCLKQKKLCLDKRS